MLALYTAICYVHQILRSNDRQLRGAGDRRDEWGVKCLMDTEFQVYKMKRAMEMDGGDDCTIVYFTYLIPLTCTLKNGSDVNFMLCMFQHNKNKTSNDTKILRTASSKCGPRNITNAYFPTFRDN